MTKKLFSFFITSFVFISGVAIMPGSVDAMPGAGSGCIFNIRVINAELIIVTPSEPGTPQISYSEPSRYVIDSEIISAYPLSHTYTTEQACNNFVDTQKQFWIAMHNPDGISESRLTPGTLLIGVNNASTELSRVSIVTSPIYLYCGIQGVATLRPQMVCTPSIPAHCIYNFDIKIDKVSGVSQCQSSSPVGSILGISLSDERYTQYSGQNEVKEGSNFNMVGYWYNNYFRPLNISVTQVADEKEKPKPEDPKPKPEDPKDEPEIKGGDNEKQQDELTPVLDTSTPLQQTQSDNSLLLGVLIGLLVGLGAVVVTYLVKRKR